MSLLHNTMLSVTREHHHMTLECSTVPYVPLQMVRAVGESSFQPKIGFKTRYGIAANPFHTGTVVAGSDGAINISSATNKYYRKVKVTNLM